jgi:membrane protein YqaA with SNARE-associated domain
MSGTGLFVSCFFLSMVSALVPWVNGELALLSLTVFARSHVHLAGLVFMASAGQMAGKCILYWAGRGAIPIKSGRIAKALNSWRGQFERSSRKTMGLVFVSAVSGIPPFYVITILSGAFRLRFSRFMAIGACGRLVHFGMLVIVPQIGSRLFHSIANHLRG